MRYRYPTENSPFLDSGFRRNNGYAEVSVHLFQELLEIRTFSRVGSDVRIVIPELATLPRRAAPYRTWFPQWPRRKN